MSLSMSRCASVTLPISHYCEKVRWALDRQGIAVPSKKAHAPMLSRVVSRCR
jgi:hypothetical protein